MRSGPFTTRDEALRWLAEHQLEHLTQLSADVLAPNLNRYRLLDLASEEGISRQTYTPQQLASLSLPQRAWQFFQAEDAARLEAERDLERRLEPPDDRLAVPLHERLLALRSTFSARVPVRADRQLDPKALVFKPELPGFELEEPHRWEMPGHFGFIDPVMTVSLKESAEVTCTCAVPRCLHALAALDTVLLWLHEGGHDDLLEDLNKAPWDRAVAELGKVFAGKSNTDILTWRLDVDDDFDFSLTPYVGNKPRAPEKLASLLDAPLPPADAALAAHLENKNPAAALAALINHPRVVLASNPHRSVTVTRTEVGLVAEDRNGSVLLTLGVDGTALPEPLLERVRRGQHERPLFLWDPGTCRLEQLDLKPELRAAFSVLTRYGNLFPPEAQPVLLKQLAEVAARVPVAMPRTVLGESTPAQHAMVVRLELQPSQAVRVELRVRPLPESDSFLPGQGPRDIHVRRRDRAMHAVRKLTEEISNAKQLEAQLPLRDAEPLVDEFTYELPSAAEALDLIQACARAEVPPAYEWVGEPVRVIGQGGPRQLKVTVDRKREREWFGVFGELSIYGERIKLAVALDAARRRRRFVRVTEHTYLELSDVLRDQLELLAGHVLPSKHGLTLGATAADTLNLLRQAGAHLELDRDFRSLTERITEARALEIAVPSKLKAELRDYQREGFEWLARLAAWGAGGVLADDMGLGKTVQALALLLHRAKLGPALVIAPTSVVFNWVEEAKRFAPSLKVHLERPDRDLRAGDVLITSYGLASRAGAEDDKRGHGRARSLHPLTPKGERESRGWSTLVLDEAHALKNAATQRARAVRDLRADFVVGLTGTPLENHLGELWSLYRIVLPSLFGSWDTFRDRFAVPIEKRIDPAAPARLSRALEPFLLRRTKAAVATELPPRTEVRVPVALSSAEWQLYEDARLAVLSDLETPRREMKEQERRLEVLAALTRLRLLASHPRLYDPASTLQSAKLLRLMELIRTLQQEGHRALVFSQFTSHLALVRELLDAEGIRYQYLDGSTPAVSREQQVRAFQEGHDPLFLISLKAGGVGLNLTAADNVIHLDPWWNPAVEDQASDRAHRIGQTRPVTVYRLVSMGTIEEKMLALHETKRALVAGVLEGKASAAMLSADELLALLG